MAPHSSTLAWKIPWMEEPGGLQSMGSLGVGHNWETSLSLFTFMHWRRRWQLTPVFLPGESQGWGSLVGCRFQGRTELDMTEVAAAKSRHKQLLVREVRETKIKQRPSSFSPIYITMWWVLWLVLQELTEKAMAPHSSTLAWKIPWMEEPGGLQSMGPLSRTRLSDFTFTFHFHALEKEMATHSSVLAWRIPGMEQPGGLASMGSHRVGHEWSDLAAAARTKTPPRTWRIVNTWWAQT